MNRRAVAVFALAIAWIGCSSDPCEDARDICDAYYGTATGPSESESSAPECTGRRECHAICIVEADSCDFLRNEILVDCVEKCEEDEAAAALSSR